MSTEASYESLLNVVDPAALRAYARELNPDLGNDMTIEEALDEVLVNPRTAPLDAGYEIMRQTVVHDHGERYRIRLVASVIDEALLVSSARESHRLAYGEDEGLELVNLGHALYEHVLGSNGSPPNLDVGFEMVDSWYEGSEVAAPAATRP